MMSRLKTDDCVLHGPPHSYSPAPLPQRGKEIIDFPTVAPLGRGWLAEALSSAEARQVTGSFIVKAWAATLWKITECSKVL